MPQIHIDQAHGLPWADAQAMAAAWAQSAQDDFGMQAQLASGTALPQNDALWHFRRTGVHGTLRVTPERFVLDLTLGFLLGTYKDRVESQVRQNLEQHLARAAHKGTDQPLAAAMAPKP